MKHNARSCHMLMKLDMACYSGKAATVATQFGEVTVKKALMPGYRATIGDGDNEPLCIGYGPTPSMALLNLGDALRRDHEANGTAKVLQFKQAA